MKVLADTFARSFGEADGAAQAELINALGAALWNSCRRSREKFDTQLCYVESDLDEHGKRFASALGQFVDGSE